MKYGKGAPGLARQEVAREEMVKIHVVLPKRVSEEITKEAVRLRLSRSRLISEIIQSYLSFVRWKRNEGETENVEGSAS